MVKVKKAKYKRIIVAGGRDFGNYKLACKEIRKFAKELGIPLDELEVACGMAPGADNMGWNFGREFLDNRVKEMPADWENLDVENCVVGYRKGGEPYNKLAGMNRNRDMADTKRVVGVLCFWDGKSTGTQNMMKLAVDRRKTMKLKVVYYDKRQKKCGAPCTGKPSKTIFGKRK
ncbi:hypothetical protein GR11A_00144 [Vibrio phage vB_VcorM_GR11A]|nr:hypothetical protein GR11A_00144 [Vibrio phage vB_VcorM_GR11A]